MSQVKTPVAENAEEIDFFISYTGVDEKWAEWVAWWLEDAGYRVFIQAWDFRPGHNFVLMMQHATRAKHTVPILSPAYLEASFTQPEWAAAVASDPTGMERRLMPIRVEECDPDGLQCPVVYIDVVDLSQLEAREKILDGVRAGRAKPAAPPAFPGSRSSSGRNRQRSKKRKKRNV